MSAPCRSWPFNDGTATEFIVKCPELDPEPAWQMMILSSVSPPPSAMAGAATANAASPRTPRVAKVRFMIFSPVCVKRTMMKGR